MNTNMTGLRWFSKIFASLCFRRGQLRLRKEIDNTLQCFSFWLSDVHVCECEYIERGALEV